MANIIIPNQERREVQAEVMRSYGVDQNDAAAREAAEVVAARSLEAREMAEKGGR